MATQPRNPKSLANTIRTEVYAKKDAPTMLPDATIDKLGLNEEDILYIEVDEEDVLEPMDEARGGKDAYDVLKGAIKQANGLVSDLNNMHVPDSDSVAYEHPKRNYKKENAATIKHLNKIISLLNQVSKLVDNATGSYKF